MYAVLVVVMGVLMVGTIPGLSIVGLIAGILSLMLGVTINAVFKLTISLFSFWIEDSNPFQWLYDKMILVIGTIFPIEIFPASLQPVFKLTPIYTVCYGPAKLFIDFSMEKFLEIFSAQIIYLAVGFMIMFFIYGKGAKKLYVNGG
ncbi:MAG: ABC-2 family transporter protein [Lachnospiraceae bacterium]|nr:ABC-2 family transporter protein [Lachnospiraceae bacterium]